jgi:membrane-bound lytic murein transglycosylase B
MTTRQKAKGRRQKKTLKALLVFSAFCVLPFAFASEASADIVVFKNGRTMSVKSCLVEAETATLRLRDGGEVTFPASILARVDPDEVPYPEDAPVEPVAPDAPVASFAPVALALVPEAVLAARPYAELISTVAATHKLDARLVHALIEQESNYQARARSKKGAKGLMQLMPDTARQYGVRNSYDPKANLEAGVRHLKDLMSRLELPLALAAYNAGEATIKRYGGVPPYAETQNYVRSILRRVGVTPGSSGTN